MENEAIKTYFNGAITQKQVIGIVVAIIAVILILSFVKKVAKLILTVAVIVGALIYLGVMSPEQLQDVSKVVAKQGQEVFTQIADTSSNVKVDMSDGLNVEVCIADQWVNVNDISSFVKINEGVYSVTINGKDYSVSDDSVKQVLDLLKR